MLAVGLNIVKGFCGQVTVGHIGLYAIGAVTSAVLSLEPGGFGGALGFGLPVWVSIPIAVLVTAFAGQAGGTLSTESGPGGTVTTRSSTSTNSAFLGAMQSHHPGRGQCHQPVGVGHGVTDDAPTPSIRSKWAA